MAVVDAQIRLQHLHAVSAVESPAEPYMLIVFYKIDGETMRIEGGRLVGSAMVYAPPCRLGDLTPAYTGNVYTIPEAIGTWTTTLRPIPYIPKDPLTSGSSPSISVPGHIGFAAALVEEDNCTVDVVNAIYLAMVQTVRQTLDAVLPSLDLMSVLLGQTTQADIEKLVTEFAKSTLPSNIQRNILKISGFGLQVVGSATDPDDCLGLFNFSATQGEFVSGRAYEISYKFNDEDDGVWCITGTYGSNYQHLWHGWGPWMWMDGGIIEGPCAVAIPDESIVVYTRGLDDEVWQTSRTATGSWRGYSRHSDRFKLGSAPSALVLDTNNRYLFARGADGAAWFKRFTGTWTPWTSLGGKIIGAPSAVFIPPNIIDVYVTGMDGRVYQKFWDGNAWRPSETDWMALDGSLTSAPSVISYGAHHRQIYGRWSDGSVCYKTWTDNKWLGWENIGGKILGPPVARIADSKTIDIYVRGTDECLWQKSWNGSSFWPSQLDWFKHDVGPIGSTPSLIATGKSRDLYVRGVDGAVYRRWWFNVTK